MTVASAASLAGAAPIRQRRYGQVPYYSRKSSSPLERVRSEFGRVAADCGERPSDVAAVLKGSERLAILASAHAVNTRELLMYMSLREVSDDDLPVFYSHSNDPEGIRVAAFTAKDPSDRTHFEAHWARIRQDPSVIVRTVVGEGDEVVGHASVFGPTEEREVTYWIGREYWGRGAATAALRELLSVVPERPLRARAAADNGGSIRVLEKCGFVVTGSGRGFANARGEEIDEVVLTLID